LDSYYRVSSDTRDLNYSLFFEKGEKKVAAVEEYTSANTHRLTDDELKAVLLELDYIQQELENKNWRMPEPRITKMI
jgi:hypothetical protein